MSGKAKYCPFCGCYIPDNQVICLACGRKYDVTLDNIRNGRGLGSINGTFSAGAQGYSMTDHSKSIRHLETLYSDNNDRKTTTQVSLKVSNHIVHEKIDLSAANCIERLIYYDSDGNKISYVGQYASLTAAARRPVLKTVGTCEGMGIDTSGARQGIYPNIQSIEYKGVFMKKLVSIFLIVCMAITLCACGNVGEVDKVVGETLKIGLITLHDENSPYDANFITAFRAACDNKQVEYLIKTNVGESSDAYNAAVDLADSGCSIIFADSFGHEDYILQAAQEFPDVQFCHGTGTKAHTENLSNYHNAFASIYEGRYLDGIALGMKLNEMIDNGIINTDEAIIGYVGAHPYAEVISGYTAFYLGARAVCPSATMKVIYTGSWYDETLENEAATSLINNGCVVISSHADSMGVPNACEATKTPFVFYNDSVMQAAPNSYITATKINWQVYFEYIIDCALNGHEIDTDWTGTLADGSVQMLEINEDVAAIGTASKLEEVTTQIINGELNIFDTSKFTVGGAQVMNCLADVDTDPAYSGDTEAIIDGVFMESTFRSAPYFDLIIDGITVLG